MMWGMDGAREGSDRFVRLARFLEEWRWSPRVRGSPMGRGPHGRPRRSGSISSIRPVGGEPQWRRATVAEILLKVELSRTEMRGAGCTRRIRSARSPGTERMGLRDRFYSAVGHAMDEAHGRPQEQLSRPRGGAGVAPWCT